MHRFSKVSEPRDSRRWRWDRSTRSCSPGRTRWPWGRVGGRDRDRGEEESSAGRFATATRNLGHWSNIAATASRGMARRVRSKVRRLDRTTRAGRVGSRGDGDEGDQGADGAQGVRGFLGLHVPLRVPLSAGVAWGGGDGVGSAPHGLAFGTGGRLDLLRPLGLPDHANLLRRLRPRDGAAASLFRQADRADLAALPGAPRCSTGCSSSLADGQTRPGSSRGR